MKINHTEYIPAEQIVITTLCGDFDIADVDEWKSTLRRTMQELPAGTMFKMLVNLQGFTAVNVATHKTFRVVIPQLLADYGWYTGYLRLFPDTTIKIQSSNNIHCIAAAHVHHDESKIRNYSANYSMFNEGYFTDPARALDWLRARKPEPDQPYYNKEIITQLYELFALGDWMEVSKLFHPQATWKQMDGFPGGGFYEGREVIIDNVFRKLKGEWIGWQANVDTLTEAGNAVFVTGEYEGTHYSTGKTFKADFIHHYTFANRRIVSFKQYTDTARITEAARPSMIL